MESQSRSLDVDERSAHGRVLSSEGEEEPGLQDVWRRASDSSSEEGTEAEAEEEEEEEDCAGPRTPAQQRLLERTLSRQVPTPAPAPEEFGSGSSAESDVDQQEVKAALFNVDVDVGGGQLRRLVVRRGDSPHALAQTFVSRHGLSDRVLPKLEALLAARVVDYQRRL